MTSPLRLTLAVLLAALAGCAAPAPMPVPVAAQAEPGVVEIVAPAEFQGQATIAMAFRLPESAYRVRATTKDVARIVVTLQTRSFLLTKTVATAEVTRAQLAGATADVRFVGLKAGTYTVEAQAFDDAGASIGKATSDAAVTEGQFTRLDMTLRLNGSAMAAGPVGQDAGAYTLAFAEEFDRLDATLWNDHVWYEPSNATRNYAVEGGALKIWPQRDASGKFFNRTFDTDGHYTQTYGYFEARAKLPVGKGTWPAFWLFAHPGDRRPEIDVMEAYAGGVAPWGRPGADGQPHPTAYAPTIWRDAGNQAGSRQFDTGSDLSAGFHTYAVKWEPARQTFYFDGRSIYSVEVAMNDPMYLLVDLWFGSASGQPDDTTPQGPSNAYQVDYVRAWRFN